MKIIQTILILYVVAFICSTSCKNDDGGDLLPVNRLPGTFEITTIISDNSAVLTFYSTIKEY